MGPPILFQGASQPWDHPFTLWRLDLWMPFISIRVSPDHMGPPIYSMAAQTPGDAIFFHGVQTLRCPSFIFGASEH